MPTKPAKAHIRDAAIPWPLKSMLLLLDAYSPNIYPSHAALARVMGCSTKTVARRLAALEAAGMIVRTRRAGTSTRYRLDIASIRYYRIEPRERE